MVEMMDEHGRSRMRTDGFIRSTTSLFNFLLQYSEILSNVISFLVVAKSYTVILEAYARFYITYFCY